MSKKIREIIDAKYLNPDRFYTNVSYEVIERDEKGNEIPTGIYQNEDGTYFTQKAWKKEIVRIEKIRMEKEKAAKKVAVSTIPLAELIDETPNTTKKNKKKSIYLIVAVILLLGIAVVGFFLYSKNETIVVHDVSKKVEVAEEPDIFGNAIITGDDVRMRIGPSLQDSILTYFPKAGERVLILQAKTDSLPWAKVERKNATVGWVYGKYVRNTKD